MMFHVNLKNIRLQQGLSQKQVADYLTVSSQSISKWEKGEALPSIAYLPKLAECLNCDINAFFAPISKKEWDMDLLFLVLEIYDKYVYNLREPDKGLRVFFDNNPGVLDLLKDMEEEFYQYQTVKRKTVQNIFGCSEEQASKMMDYFIKFEYIEKLETEDSYFVIRDNLRGMRILLSTMEMTCRCLFP